MKDQYFLGNNNGKPTITVVKGLQPSVERDLLRVCGKSENLGHGLTVYTCLIPEKLSEAEKILQGAMMERSSIGCCEFADCNNTAVVQAPDDWVYPGALCCAECYSDPLGVKK